MSGAVVSTSPAPGTRPDPGASPTSTPEGRRALGAAVAAVVLMSVGAPLVKAASIDGLSFAMWRVWLAAVAYVVVAGRRGRLDRRAVAAAVPGGLLFGLDIVLFYSAVRLTSAANATVINALQPALVLVVVGPLFGERPRRSLVAWTTVATFGVVLVVLGGAGGGTGDVGGDLLALAAMFVFTAYFLASKRARVGLDALTYTAAMLAVAGVALVPLMVVTGPPAVPGWLDVVWIVAMIAVPGTGHLLTNHAHGWVPLSLISLLWLAGPVLTSLWAWWLLDEGLAVLQVVGAALTLAALAVVVSRPSAAVS